MWVLIDESRGEIERVHAFAENVWMFERRTHPLDRRIEARHDLSAVLKRRTGGGLGAKTFWAKPGAAHMMSRRLMDRKRLLNVMGVPF